MSLTPREPVSRESLVPGVWISFHHDNQPIPSKAIGSFQIISRSDDPLDPCRCTLLNSQGQKIDYSPRMRMLGVATLPIGYHVKVLSREKMETSYQKRIEELHKRFFPN
jgi:hypothetical protein